MSDQIRAPFTDDQVAALNAFQDSGVFHPFTCGNCRTDLIATKDGWKCPDHDCDYKQDWAHAFMADPKTLDLDWRKLINKEPTK